MSNEMRLFLIALILAAFSGCVTSYQPIGGEINFVDHPPLGKVSSVEIGSPLLSKSKVETRDGYNLNEGISKLANPLHPMNSGFRVTLEADQYYLAQKDKDYKIYYPINPNSAKGFALAVPMVNKAGIAVKGNEIFGFIDYLTGIKIRMDDIDVTPVKINLLNKTNFKQELIYNGKQGNVIRMMYREYRGDMARPAFAQDLTYDLSESRVVGFQGVRMEILSTDNIQITYKVLNGFPNSN